MYGTGTGHCDLVRRLSGIENYETGVLRLVVLNCRSSITILTRRWHVPRYMYASQEMGVILEYSRSLCRGGFYRGTVHYNVRLLLCKKRKTEKKRKKVEGKRWKENVEIDFDI